MVYYVKCNEKTYAHIGSPAQRVRLKDGNYIAWQGDFACFPGWPDMRSIAALTGSLLLQADEAYEEQEGIVCRALPEATDERFFVPSPEPEEPGYPMEPEEPEYTEGSGEDAPSDDEASGNDADDETGPEESEDPEPVEPVEPAEPEMESTADEPVEGAEE
ncbi:MAG: hypothetical protein HFJ95_01615 [Muribaculaceae bacterium]|nr:hypothetical protein [Muribaculaceae bacterium]